MDGVTVNRKPPVAVKKILREEVGFGCPVSNCGLPYLEWHHFDPPWNEKHHHNPEGMIALCREHHIQADNGAFTKKQLHRLKQNGKDNWRQISGQFNWMRNRLLAVVGGNFYYETPVILKFREQPVIWFERDENNYLLLNLHMLTTIDAPRAYITNNEWFNVGGEENIEFLPSAKRLRISYPNGDLVSIEFFEIDMKEDANRRYPDSRASEWPIELPITAVEVTYVVANSGLEFNAKETKFGMGNIMKNCFSSHCDAGLSIR